MIVYRLFITATVALILSIVGLAATYGYFRFFEKPFLSYGNIPFPVMEKETPAGAYISLKVMRCNSSGVEKNYTGTHALEEISTHKITLLTTPFHVVLPPGCHEVVSNMNKLPKTVAPGTYRVFGTAEVDGRLVKHRVHWYSQPFTVTLGRGVE